MADYARLGQAMASQPVPQGLNQRLVLVRDTLSECEKVLYELRARLGIGESPSPGATEKSRDIAGSTGTLTMELLATSGRLGELLRSTLHEITG